MVITGQWRDGAPPVAIPNFARMNRVGPPPDYPSDRDPERWKQPELPIDSKVWIWQDRTCRAARGLRDSRRFSRRLGEQWQSERTAVGDLGPTFTM